MADKPALNVDPSDARREEFEELMARFDRGQLDEAGLDRLQQIMPDTRTDVYLIGC